jgi:nicotinamidase/pyrazinamidase
MIFDLVYSYAATIEALDSVDENNEAREGSVLAPSTTSSKHLTGANVIFATDCLGNTILHLCVLHGLQDMYEHVYNTAINVVSRELRKLYAKYVEENPKVGTRMHGLELFEPADREAIKGYTVRSKILEMPERHKLDEWVATEAKRKVDERLVLALNEDFHSPLTLAASIINKDKDTPEKNESKVKMFTYLLKKMEQVQWTYGPITMALLDLEGVEIKYNVEEHYQIEGREQKIVNMNVDSKMHAAINWLCINDADGAILIPEVKKLIQTKWERVGYPFFILSFCVHMTLTALVTLILIFVNATPSTHVIFNSIYVVNVLYPIVALAYFVMFVQEVFNGLRFGAQFFKLRGIARFDKFLRLVKILSFVSFCCLKATNAWRFNTNLSSSENGVSPAFVYNNPVDQGTKIALTVCIIASWFHLYYFLMGFDSTGPFMLTIFRIVAKDVPYFLKFYAIVVVAFACALSMLSNSGDSSSDYGFLHLIKAIWTLIQNTVSLNATQDVINEIHQFYPRDLQWLADILLTFYYFSVNILMLNLLIAMINATYAQYTEYNDAILLMAKYNIMHGMEKVMWEDELKENRRKYSMIDDRPDNVIYCHVSSKLKGNNTQKETPADVLPSLPVDAAARAAPLTPAPSSAALEPGASHKNSGKQRRNSSLKFLGNTFQKVQRSLKFTGATHETKVVRYLFEMETVKEEWWSSEQMKVDAESMDAHRKTSLFIVDPQVDFHPADPKWGTPSGSLAIPGANEDSQRIADMIDKQAANIDEIYVSMDSHYPCHIAHSVSWVNDKGENPEPGTEISHEDVLSKKWMHRDATRGFGERLSMQEWVLHYTSALERHSRLKLTIWPEHCLIGTQGHSVVPVVNDALQRWAAKSKRQVHYIMKGQNLRTECYSALQAEVEDPTDQSTALNSDLLAMLKISDRVNKQLQAATVPFYPAVLSFN